MLLLLLDGVGLMAFGDYAKLNDTEKMMIQEPLQRILSKLSPTNLDIIGKYADPVLLLMGLMSWVSRITTESRRRKQEAKAQPEEPKPEQVKPEVLKPSNGNKPEYETFAPDDIVNNFASAGVA